MVLIEAFVVGEDGTEGADKRHGYLTEIEDCTRWFCYLYLTRWWDLGYLTWREGVCCSLLFSLRL